MSVEELNDVDRLSAVAIDFKFLVLLKIVCIDTTNCKSFGELSNTFLDVIFRMYRVASRIDIACDRYDMEVQSSLQKERGGGGVDG